MKRVIVFLYGILSYVFFLGIALYAIGFVGNILVPKSIDSVATDPVGTAILINSLILGLFAVQHTIMARPAFKKMIGKIIPQAAERSTFVLVSNVIFVVIFWQWRPIDGIVWEVSNTVGIAVLDGLFWLGWGIFLISTFLIDHLDLFGLRQVTRYLMKKEPQHPTFKEHSLYKVVRHPIMLGFVIAFWATPVMTMGHLFFSIMTTGYILVGIWFEERDLIKAYGQRYLDYANRVPRLIPFLKLGKSGPKPTPSLDDTPGA